MTVSYSHKLRWLAAYLDTRPELAEKMQDVYDYPSVAIWASDWDEFQTLIRKLDGYDKSGSYGDLKAEHRGKDVDGQTMYAVRVYITGVCEAKPKLDDDGKPVMRKKFKSVETDEEEPVVEYHCPEVWSS